MRKDVSKEIRSFIKINFKEQLDITSSIKEIRKLAEFIDKNVEIDQLDELFDEIMKNANLVASLNLLIDNLVIETNKEISSSIKNALSDHMISTLINMFCEATEREISVNIVQDYYQIDVSDSVSMYLKEIGRYPLLTRQKEFVLARNASLGDKKSRNDLINCNLRLVVSIARSFINKGLPFEDLIQEGNLGLMKAMEKYDYQKGYKFSTYSTWWIKQRIRNAIKEKSGIIKLSHKQQDEYNLYLKAHEKLSIALDCAPSDEDIAKYLKFSVEKVKKIKLYPVQIISLNAKTLEDAKSDELMDFIKSDDSLEENSSVTALYDNILSFLDDLNEQEKAKIIFKRRFNPATRQGDTLTEIGNDFGITHERVRQLEARILRKIRMVLEVQEKFPTSWRSVLETKNMLKKKEVVEETIPVEEVLNPANELIPNLIPLIIQYFKVYTEEEIKETLESLSIIEQKVLYNVLLLKNNLITYDLKVNPDVILNHFETILMRKFNLDETILKNRKRQLLINILKDLYDGLDDSENLCIMNKMGVR